MLQRLLAAILVAITASASAASSRPNVVIVLVDDQGYGDLSCHGNPVLQTPHLDALHGQSVRLTDFHVAPMCTPTRGQLLTGMDALRNGAMNVSSGRTLLRAGIPTMASIFSGDGYRTGVFGKWHLGDNHPYRPQDRGFQETLWYPSSHIGSAPDYWDNDYFDDTYWRNDKRRKFKGYTTDVFFGEAIDWMRDQGKAGKPFLCYIPLAAAHAPLFVPEKYRELYKDQRPNLARFFGMIANIDENIGKLDAFLSGSGLRDNTILIFMTDNGGTVGVPFYNAGMKGGKITLWEGGHRVPCFIRWPAGKLRPPGDIDELTQVQDILPTLLDLCSLNVPRNTRFDGVSLARLLRGQTQSLDDRMLVVQFSRMNDPSPDHADACVMWKKWRLISDKELYNVADDPGQKQNVIARHADIAGDLRAHYEYWWREIEPRVNEPSSIIIGSQKDNPTMLSPCDWFDVFLDQGAQVRRGDKKNGVWHLTVEHGGDYEFELRRWPRESNTPMTAGLPVFKHADGEYPAGVALPIAEARLKIGDSDERRIVAAGDKSVTFNVRLKSGPTQLQTWFLDAEGKELCGAYYVYLRRK